jgi:CBS domain-containing protein
MRVRDVMTHGAIGAPETATLAEAVETLLKSRVSALLVFNAQNQLVGLLSEGDLLRRAELGTARKRASWLDFLLSGGSQAETYAQTHGRKVGEIMTKDVRTISEDAEISEAVDMMLDHSIKRLPVLRGEDVVGIVSRSDILKALLASLPKANAPQSDADIKSAILAQLDKLNWAPRASVGVEVQKGVVTLTGAITDERMREGLKVIAENTPGVTETRDQMIWIEPNSGYYMG